MAVPSVGRIVHHIDADPAVNLAAVITQVNGDGTVHLYVWAPNGIGYGAWNVPESPTAPYATFSWHWPEVVA